jgi:hypothetical protein
MWHSHAFATIVTVGNGNNHSTMEKAMCGMKRRTEPEVPYDGETQKLQVPHVAGGRCGIGFPWQMLWLIWPLTFLFKGAFVLAAPAIAWLSQPLALTITPLPLLLVAAGLAVLLFGARRRG